MSAGALVRRAVIRTLGCRINDHESELIAQQLRGVDFKVVDSAEDADLVVINTCAVTAEASRQTRQEIRRAIRSHPKARVLVTGCYAETDPQAVAAIGGVHAVIGNERKLDVRGWLREFVDDRRTFPAGDALDESCPPRELLKDRRSRTRAIVQVQQGCDHDCTFCIVHTARGPSRSLDADYIGRQVNELVSNGCREIVLAGVDLGAYGADLSAAGAYRLPQLLDRLCSLPGDFRIRLSSLDPVHLDDELISRFGQHERLCPHLHLSLQSGNEIILKRMKRRCPGTLARERVRKLRRVRPDLVLAADLMVGFPTETATQFEDTEGMVSEMEISFAHVFGYSPRPGTSAARIPASRQVTVAEKRERAARLRHIATTMLDATLERRIGLRARVLVEKDAATPEGLYRARAADFLTVWVPSAVTERGQFAEVCYTDVRDRALIGRVTA
jgi:threonylcarbamoyladenosine tRNA methylthiotransferase MtaB